MPAYLTPGVYRRPQPAEQQDVRLVRTDVAGFVGFAERGPLPSPGTTEVDPKTLAVRLTSWKQFVTTFGGFIPYGYLAYAVRGFFENGGTTCYVVRVAATHHSNPQERPRAASVTLPGDVAPIEVTQLASDVGAGQTDLILDNARGLREGDLVAIEGNGVIEFAMVAARLDNVTIELGQKTKADHYKGETIWKYSSGLLVTASSHGNWGKRIKLAVSPLTPGPTAQEFSLRVTVVPGLDTTQPKEEEFYKRLSLVQDDPNYAPNVINAASQLMRVHDLRSEQSSIGLLVGEGIGDRLHDGPVRYGSILLSGGRDGLSRIQAQDFTGGMADLCGLRLLEEIDEVAILCAPDAVFEAPPILPKRPVSQTDPCKSPPKPAEPDPVAEDPTAIPPAFQESDVAHVYRAVVDQCERLRDRVAILDFRNTSLPEGQSVRSLSPLVAWRKNFTTRFGAIYYPWLKVPDPLEIDGLSRRVPPSGHVAGIYARIDNQFGVQRPPANAALEFVTDVVDEITALEQESLNPYGVNALRPFPGRGIRVWGARSLAGEADTDWRFIHVRRLMSMIEESVEDSTQWAVFEPNDFALRRTLVHSLSVFLEQIWRTGGLKGTVPSEGFYVKCDETNNPPAVVEAGQLICEVGVAIVAPMEFLVFEIRQRPGVTEVTER